ncbi:PMCA-type calcium-translocating P-type ATPase [Mycotypha africana]|uniref:PMCA-type calcium-translocating P-type ATPase n=1 Tax=Mycotypha africana TaxID=64632 RepID=UPI0023001070|nr:PMCA-type calcium-translocating P-type ATPase [Mycotypha africana]KAI8991117.1 PMCA-type calcium-translocating P-type ATPase [Mycotypha africana]
MPPTREERQSLVNNNYQNGGGHFDISVEELSDLFDPKNEELLQKLGGVKAICKKVKVDPSTGLSADEGSTSSGQQPYQDRQATFGRNVLPEPPSKTFLQLLWAAYNDKTLIMLSIASLVSLAVGIWEDYSPRHPPDEPRVGWVEGTAIIVAVLAVVLTNAINDYQKEAQFKKLNAKKEDRVVKVLRGGREQQISVYDVNVGDVLLLEPGDIIPVDGLYLEGHNLACDESSATGESDTMKKKPEGKGDCFILSGAKVLEGVGKMVVLAVGENSFFGKTMMSMRGEEAEGTPLQMKLDTLAEQIAKLGFAAAIIMLFALVIKYFVTAALAPEFPAIGDVAAAMIRIVIQAITIIVVAVPEGLPMAVTMALAFATTQMLKDNNLVRVLAACETMGNATAICSDKTGTLTQNKMTVVEGTLAEETFTSEDEMKAWAKKVDKDTIEALVHETIALNSTAFEGKDENGRTDFVGSKTECALLGFSKRLGSDYEAIRHDATITKVYPFASKRKTMTTISEIKENSAPSGREGARYRIHTKGASEIVLEACTHYITAQGERKALDTEEAKKKFLDIISRYADKALRTLALAFRDISASDMENSISDEEPPLEGLTLLGIVGIMDPLRPGVVESVAAFRQAGVFVRMITGDNINTAKAIARNAGILTKGGIALTGPELRAMSVEEQRKIIPRLQVVARSSPKDKTIVVSRLQEQDQVVGMTGDGTNDGPALKMADVGFSMGIAGTEVAKEASDIILMDDNFNSILKALLWGRAVNDGVRKFLTFQLTVNIAAVVLSFISAVGSEEAESILSAVQLLWVNLIMDTLAALALATEPPTQDLLHRKPISKFAHLINYRMAKMIGGQAIFQVLINLIVMYMGPRVFHLSDSAYDQAVLRTMVFNIFVFLQVFNEINCRRIDNSINVFKDMFDNWIFIAVQVAVIVGQFLIVTFGGIAFKTVPLTPQQWLITVLIGSLSLPLGTVIRLLPDGGYEDRYNEEAKPLASYSRMHWEGAIGDVRNELRVYSLLRRNRGATRRSSTMHSGDPLPFANNANTAASGHYGATRQQQNRFANLVKNAQKYKNNLDNDDQ